MLGILRCLGETNAIPTSKRITTTEEQGSEKRLELEMSTSNKATPSSTLHTTSNPSRLLLPPPNPLGSL
ncbi:hypothetical protein RHMOL_Rhmol11G0020400 [Rhododendron molle]|uniref:Uncharacterized protein n=1 Tax=Rhododendron molle TaxID=49168 RepID=A0ACC0LPA8_RHOML|nr:hypothetical protein RHMOL_Rhmol11G0020400 [Rhododendron molle]